MTSHKGICSTNTKIGCNGKDRSALLIFKQGVVDRSNKLSSWSNEEDCCSWKGVQCDDMTGRVIRLDLKQEYLEGLNQSLVTPSNTYANFSNLEYLDLSFNEDLHLDHLQWLSQLSSLKWLNLNEINLENIGTNWLQTMAMHPSLLELRLARCNLIYINLFVKFVNFTSLVTLDLSENYFGSKLPYWLFNISRGISHIDLSFNALRGQIPESLLNLQNLKYLRLNNNELTGPIPDWLGKHEHLQHLDITENWFSGSFPSSLGNLSSLTQLSVSSNFLSGNLSNSIGQLFNLRSLYIGGSLSGVLSEKHFSKLFNLESLALKSAFAFDLDPNWIPPFQLHKISLRNTILGPTFPEWLYTLRTLEALDISYSGISSINANKFWSFVANIREIRLSNNAISADLSNVTLNSEYIFMDQNNFTGGFPRISTNVFHFDVSHNSLSGPISFLLCPKLGRKKNTLSYLDVSYNLLTGVIPDCWENWRGLTFLNINNNKLGGEIPPSMGLLNKLASINLGNNNFSGVVPTKMPKSIEVMELSSNQFTGNIPPQLCSLLSLELLDLSQNKLFGEIPPELFGLTQLLFLNLSTNHFIGRILGNIGSMKSLEVLDLSNNHLSGEIPVDTYSSTLSFLNLSYNDFIGEILGNGIWEFDSWSFVGNPKLCGPPLSKNCSDEVNHDETKQDRANNSQNGSFYLGMEVGYIVGLSGVWYSLFLNKEWRHKYFRILDHTLDCLYVFVALKLNKFGELGASSR